MKLKNFFKNLKKEFNHIDFVGFDFNSKRIKKNYIFFALQGSKFDGNNYINEAIKKGARIIVSNKYKTKINNDILYIKVKDPRLTLSNFAAKYYNKKPNNIIAVTGTNGKSSIVNFYYQILKLNKKKVASIGTLGVKSNNSNLKLDNTTVDVIRTNKILFNLKSKKIENVILEASSHGLHQKRLNGIKFNTSIFTNLSRDHLDYHKNYKNYFNSKLILFNELTNKNGNLIFDSDLKYSQIFKKIAKKKKINSFSIGVLNSNLKILSIKILSNIQIVKFSYQNKEYQFKTSLVGKIQIKNLMMAVAAAIKSNIKIDNIVKNLEYIKPAKGRLEIIGKTKNNSIIILDYAHTPEALKTCIENVKEQFGLRKINIVFGCGGERDKEKRPIMGKIANKLCDFIYLTDDNPRSENPKKIRDSIKKSILPSKMTEIPSRKLAIRNAVLNSKSDEVLIIAGKGHESIQEYRKKKQFSDAANIKKSIIIKNRFLTKDWKLNIFKELIKDKKLNRLKNFKISTNSKIVNKGKIFFGIKGKTFNGNDFADEALKNGAELAILQNTKNISKKIINVNNTLKLLIEFSKKIITSSNASQVAITGSSGKTSLKELLGQCLQQIHSTTYSKNSYNNKFGLPISIINLNKDTTYGLFEIGMDKKGEIDYLSKIIKPDIGVITNITYAHAKNFSTLFDIAKAKSEIIFNIKKKGTVVLNKDDKFFDFFSKLANRCDVEIISFGKNKKSDIGLSKIKKSRRKSILYINVCSQIYKYTIDNNLLPYIDNILASLAVCKRLNIIDKIKDNFFSKYKIPSGRGNIKKISVGKKKINIIDESYNSNPLSLNFSINKFNNLKINPNKKFMLLGDMLELGKFSKRLHIEAAKDINKAKFKKLFVYGKNIIDTFNKIRTQKRGKILKSKGEILNIIKNDLNNEDFLMIKGSNSTGLNQITKEIGSKFNVI